MYSRIGICYVESNLQLLALLVVLFLYFSAHLTHHRLLLVVGQAVVEHQFYV